MITLMNNEIFEGDHLNLTCSVGPDNVIYLSAVGKITNSNLDVFVKWAERVKQLMEKVSQKEGVILVYSDVSGVDHFERKPIIPLRELFEYDKRFTMKSAIVGASFFTKKLIDAVADFTGRTNIQQFSSKEIALAWLLNEGGVPLKAEGDQIKTEE